MKKPLSLLKKTVITFLLFSASILFALLLGELTIRKLEILDRKFDHLFTLANSFVTPNDDEHIKYALIPNFNDKIKLRHGQVHNVTYSINSLGLRGPEPRREKDSINVVVIGDSISFGLGVEDNYVYPVVLEKKLNSWAEQNNVPLDFEIHNCSVPGYNSEQEYFFCKDIVEGIKPKIIIWQYFFNDTSPPMQFAMGNLVWNFEQRFPSHLLFLLNSFLYKNKPSDKIGPKGVLTSIESMAEIASSIDAKFFTFIAPSSTSINYFDTLKEDVPSFVRLLRNVPHEYIDVISGFNGLSTKDIEVRPGDDHWNRRGHELVADQLTKRLIKDLF